MKNNDKARHRRKTNGSAAHVELDDVDRRIREFTEAHPLLAIGMLVAAGYVMGRVVARL